MARLPCGFRGSGLLEDDKVKMPESTVGTGTDGASEDLLDALRGRSMARNTSGRLQGSYCRSLLRRFPFLCC